MENVEITIKTPLEGEISVKVPYDNEKDLTWMELTRYFTQALKGLGYFPDNLEEFISGE